MERKNRKGRFGEPGLPVARRYLFPDPRRRWILAGAVAAAALLAVILWDFAGRDGELLAAGTLSSAHALSDRDCASCHQPFGKVESARCSSCHEKVGDELGVYGFAAHYLYRSNDFGRLTTSENELPCAACHPEHRGREAAITRVADARCVTCHEFGSFNERHPQFDFAADGTPDDGGLIFPHTRHVRELMDRDGLVDVERACLACHEARADGRSFEPISFDRHCDACHLSAGERTPRLPIREPGERAPGVLTLEAFQTGGGPGDWWAYYANPNEYRQAGSGVTKSPLHHQDRWVMENLRRLRQILYPDAGLADLLTASAEVPPERVRDLYREAVARLEEMADGLRGRPEPEVQVELLRITTLLKQVERALEDPYAPLDETEFLLALERPDPGLDAETAAEIEEVVAGLTAPCQRCHRLERATFARVDADQRTLRRAEFDHRAHILQVRCLECHAEIPILEHLAAPAEIDPAADRAEIHNLPRIETCQECHDPDQASNRCVTCHQFHPDPARRADLLLYRHQQDGAPPDGAPDARAPL